MEQSARSAPSHKRPLTSDGELVELLWQDGTVVAQAQTQRRSLGRGRSGGGGGDPGASGVTGEGEEAAAWFPDGDALDSGGLYPQLWRGDDGVDGPVGGDKGAFVRPPARSGAGSSRAGEAGSSFCGSNMVTGPALRADDDADENLPDADETRTSTRPAAKRRARVAEVHNLSERRRRDRINEKMRVLQELVPHCNKTDKASILDEAIEYLKSLQLQLQIMWMTTGMSPMMIPGAHQLMSPMAMGLNPACMLAAQGLNQLQRVPLCMNNPLPNQMPQVPSPATNSPNVANQIQNNGICEPRSPFLHPNDTLTTATQVPAGVFPFGSHMAQQNEIQESLASNGIPASGARQPPSFGGIGT